MKYILALGVLFLISLQTKGQNQLNNVEIITNNNLTYWVMSPEHLENSQTISNAIIVRVKSKNSNCTIFARLTNLSFPSGFSMPSGFIKLDWSYDNSNKDYNLVTTPISLETSEKFLFNQKKMPSSVNYYDYYYDLIMTPPAYSMVPGSYSFNLLFTMTQP